jgi:transposase InsO family protein
MTTRNLKNLNAYSELKTTAGINTVRQAILANAVPAGLTPAQAAKFTTRFLNGNWIVVPLLPAEGGLPIHGANRLRYRPQVPASAQPINLLVAYDDERAIFMNRVWNDRQRGYGVGLQAFYHQVAMSYLNIKKIHTDEFLTSKGDYQLQKTPQPKVIAPIVTQRPNQRWGMDLIDMSIGMGPNRLTRYILTVVDYFSGYIWARYIQNKNPITIRNALNNICTAQVNPPLVNGLTAPAGAGGTYPSTLQMDNGGEFRNATMTAWAGVHNVVLMYTQSYTPKSNGKVERKNREIRKKIKAGYLRQNAKVWTIHLNDYVININAQSSSRKNVSAKQLWQPGNPPILPMGPASVSLTPGRAAAIERNFLELRAQRWTHGALPRFQVGDNVRVDLFSLSSEYRRKVKERDVNKLTVHWSPVVCTVVQVFPPNGQRRREMYSLQLGTPNGLPPAVGGPVQLVTKQDGRLWLFAGNQLTKAGDLVNLNPRNIPTADAMNSTN